MRKPPELLVMTAPAVVVTALVVTLGLTVSGSGSEGARQEAPSVSPKTTAEAQAGDVSNNDVGPAAEVAEVQPFLVAPPTTLEPKPEPKFRTLDSYSFTIATFNILGASHTSSGGKHSNFASAAVRMTGTLNLLNSVSADIVGLQEYQSSQYHMMMQRAGGKWDAWPGLAYGPRGVANSVAWDQSLFRPVERHVIQIPYFGGRLRPMPYVLLEHIPTGQRLWVANFHNPADARGPAARFRAAATNREIALANDLARDGYPVFFTGDMNDRERYFCPVTMNTTLKSASGGSTGSPCQPPAKMPVDWIFGSDRVAFSGYRIIHNRASNHPLISANATVPQAKIPINYRRKR